ncbi:hypothetical protein TWF481_001920 [Arthrobotrys musiformis]|uniref:Uncharacterized protein n=1 Tax=Arthrobotrys musiformis TaxID=47236 RepID=A0AAV9VWR8_9PEZI
MHQPAIERGNTIQQHQDALNNIPFFVKTQNPSWQWNPVDRFFMSWNKFGSAGGSSSNDAVTYGADPEPAIGTKEPYYLKGQDEGDSLERDLRLLGGPLSGFGGDLGFGSGSVTSWKRSRTSEESAGQVLQERNQYQVRSSPEEQPGEAAHGNAVGKREGGDE